MNDGGKPGSTSRQLLLQVPTDSAVANRDHDAIELRAALQKVRRLADNIPLPQGPSIRPCVVKKHDLLPTGLEGRIGDHLPMPARTEQRQKSHGGLPLNRGIVDSPAALMPSRLKTLRTVIKMIRASSKRL